MDYDYNKNVMSKKKHADLILNNNYPEDLEKNFLKITTLVDLYFENEGLFKSCLEEEKHKESEDKSELVERMKRELKSLQDEKRV
jgi:hypothetical protein